MHVHRGSRNQTRESHTNDQVVTTSDTPSTHAQFLTWCVARRSDDTTKGVAHNLEVHPIALFVTVEVRPRVGGISQGTPLNADEQTVNGTNHMAEDRRCRTAALKEGGAFRTLGCIVQIEWQRQSLAIVDGSNRRPNNLIRSIECHRGHIEQVQNLTTGQIAQSDGQALLRNNGRITSGVSVKR
jgi:hypothetical protein